MYDFHSHILPDVPGDDGARGYDMAYKMARQSVESGFTHVLATSHFVAGEPFGERYHLESTARAFSNVLAKQGVNIRIVPVHEAYLTTDLIKYIERGDVIRLANNAVLIELPMTEWMKETLKLIIEIQELKLDVVIAHPERCSAIAEDPALAVDLIDCGAFLQLNLGSLRDPKSKTGRAARALLKYQAYHFVGSDAHSHLSRSPSVAGELEHLRALVTPEYFELITKKNPFRAFNGQKIENQFDEKWSGFESLKTPQTLKEAFWNKLEAWRFGKK